MRDAVLAFSTQFEFQPVVENKENLKVTDSFVLTGMGGSHLNADLLLAVAPHTDIIIHRDYGLPLVSAEKAAKSLFIASSYSGNTEEVIEAYNEAKEKGYALAAIAVGGTLLELAKADGVPYVAIPDTGIQPRSALAFSFMALLSLTGKDAFLKETQSLRTIIDPADIEQAGKDLAAAMKDRVPLVYASRANETVAWNWKIKLNETGKIPAFYNVFPELNHNEMTGFDVVPTMKHLAAPFHVVLLEDGDDHPKVQQRMDVLATLYSKRGLPVTRLALDGNTRLEKIFRSLLLADWTAVHTAALYGLESEHVPMVEEFKKMIAS
ncbi:MAG: Bifunctional phosphoglucose/phosphomannose isomerase [Candidatus Magasanikbacteria bacterium GW2011_GWD2_43_18]|uniref:Bifunctional phosphoglucose/phosphomannose isomerase n=1 Tax=Candidatus Magasanikbacteria bacterium GW2011_GWE2_42_7 TaxID=1619052 RepID=A0A0G1E8H6_9BACT|nr:MAG: Bifunctional phosphoglucose/phosphomannose isomerase [Candidatus Magasanikbacteria bacterium GW2011_GWC2_42_27]KKS70883.1 MAG: Bifunctional phosphoglucose/phosphomannose isomerase [Candidatus Magasanikbacteria bacterium GW2011_GWE2_42_7]KKT04348.1 MAG: Bifunctional phosphoglucose/phosphomannose isomerase [Candidatus Magasanikbacteria bacterium GW2011_GWD2_43_18]KKT25344.1 MAG: Bifunctional phosphoglucose/phosphomannose isomerase [Candidatus Magasanikbacteria bacterium GW2011_GWA2_43_9]